MPGFEIPGMPGAHIGMININDMLGKAFGGQRTKTRRVTVRESYEILIDDESDKLLDNEQIVQEAIKTVENNGIVFLDEIDKICARSERVGADVSREGVQRDLLPLIEGTTVGTKYGPVKTDHILFIASGAFHVSKPSDLLPELQGRLPIRVTLLALTGDDFRRILREPQTSLIKQYIALMAHRGRRAGVHRGRHRCHRRCRRRGQFGGREHRRAAAFDRDGARARRDQLRCSGPGKHQVRHRRGLCAEARRRPRQERGPVEVHSVAAPGRRRDEPRDSPLSLSLWATGFTHFVISLRLTQMAGCLPDVIRFPGGMNGVRTGPFRRQAAGKGGFLLRRWLRNGCERTPSPRGRGLG